MTFGLPRRMRCGDGVRRRIPYRKEKGTGLERNTIVLSQDGQTAYAVGADGSWKRLTAEQVTQVRHAIAKNRAAAAEQRAKALREKDWTQVAETLKSDPVEEHKPWTAEEVEALGHVAGVDEPTNLTETPLDAAVEKWNREMGGGE